MAVRDHLARCVPRIGEAEAIHDIVETGLKELKQDFAGNAAPGERSLEITAKLAFQQTVLVAELLLLRERDGVVALLAARTFRAMHARRIILAFQSFRRAEDRHS